MSRLSSFLKNPARVPAKLPNPSAKRIAVSPTEIEIWHAHHARQSGAPQLIGTKGMRPIGALIAGADINKRSIIEQAQCTQKNSSNDCYKNNTTEQGPFVAAKLSLDFLPLVFGRVQLVLSLWINHSEFLDQVCRRERQQSD